MKTKEEILEDYLDDDRTKESILKCMQEYASQFKAVEVDHLKQEVERRLLIIISEPDGVLRETMITNLLIDL